MMQAGPAGKLRLASSQICHFAQPCAREYTIPALLVANMVLTLDRCQQFLMCLLWWPAAHLAHRDEEKIVLTFGYFWMLLQSAA